MSQTKPELSSADKRLIEFKENKIDFNDSEMVDNRRIADMFVKKFIQYLRDECKLKYIKCQRQGSAFENVSVFNPNNIDYLLVLSAELEDIPNDKPKKDLTELFRNRPKYLQDDMSAYKSIQIPEFIKEHTEYKKFCNEWPGTNQKCVSSHAINSLYKAALYKFWEKNKSALNIEGVVRIDLPPHHDPALTIKFTKADGAVISVYMKSCMRLFSPEGDQYFIPKMTHAEADEVLGGDRDRLLWLQTNSMEEKDAIWSKFEHQRENYRIVKGLLYNKDFIANDGTESYIIKAIFLRDTVEEELIFKTPTDYLIYFLKSLGRAYNLEQKRRQEIPLTRQERKKDAIQGYMNPGENVLARYSNTVIQRKIRELNGLLTLGFEGCVDKLLS